MRITRILALLFALVLVGTPAVAGDNYNEGDECVPWEGQEYIAPTHKTVVVTEAWTETITAAYWQRYSYNGPWHSNTEAPPFPSDKWQANVAGDPHEIGVAGPYFRSHGNSGKGDWFYLEWVAAVTKDHPEVTEQVVDNPGQEYIAPIECPTVEPPIIVTDPPVIEPPVVEPPTVAPPAVPVPETPTFTG